MRVILVLLLALTSMFSVDKAPPVHDRVRAATVRLTFPGGSVCGGTAIGPREILTATHCITDRTPISIDGVPVGYLVKWQDDKDHTILLTTQVRKEYVSVGNAPNIGDVVFMWGQPAGLENILRYGRLAGRKGEDYVYDINAIQGDSGSAVFNTEGEIVGMISAVGVFGPFLIAIAHPMEI